MLNSRTLTYLSEKNYDVIIKPYHMVYWRNTLNKSHSKQDLVTALTEKHKGNCYNTWRQFNNIFRISLCKVYNSPLWKNVI